MARCQRCNGCQSQWDFTLCKHCGFPSDDTRTPEEIIQDDADIAAMEHPQRRKGD